MPPKSTTYDTQLTFQQEWKDHFGPDKQANPKLYSTSEANLFIPMLKKKRERGKKATIERNRESIMLIDFPK